MAPRTSVTSTKLELDTTNPLHAALCFIDDRHRIGGSLAIRHHNGIFYRYAPTTGYAEAEVATLRADLYAYCARAFKSGGQVGERYKPTANRVSEIIDAIKGSTHWPVDRPAPCWLEGAHDEEPYDLLPCSNGILHLPTRKLLPPTPHLFALNGIGFPFSATASAPTQWLKFLDDILPDDPTAHALLQEWIGYLLTTRTHFQKILMVVGPKRSGKGTVGRIIRELVGSRHLVAPTLSNLGEQFGRASLIDKPVAIVADARLSGRTDVGVLSEVLLSISGEDPQTIPRKNLTDWTGMLSTRFTILTNEIPRILDSSGALASRFLLLLLRESFYGREDQTLFTRLKSELPGILLWALDGLDRVIARGHFQQPESAQDALTELENLSSPVTAFVRDVCVVRTGLTCSKDELYQSYRTWCQGMGQSFVDTQPTFFRNLRAALPFIGESRPGSRDARMHVMTGIAIAESMTPEDSFVV